MDLAAPPLAALQPRIAAPTAASGAAAAKVHRTAQDFEASFLQVMLGQMMSGAGQIDASFTGGEAEGAFRSFLTDAMARGVVKAGGVGVSQTVERELLRLQAAAPGALQGASA